MFTRLMLSAATVMAIGLGAAQAETHEVRMLNQDPEDRSERMVFEPAVLQIAPGDTVRFVAAAKGHNAQSAMVPDGGTEFRGAINEEIEVTFDTEGTYFYICQPHQTLGMIGLILVGDHTKNFDAVVENAPVRGPMATKRLEAYAATAEEISTAAAE